MSLPIWYHVLCMGCDGTSCLVHVLSGGMGMMSLPIWSHVSSRRGYGPKGMVQGGMVPEVGILYPHTGI